MATERFLAIAVLVVVVSLAGCAGILPDGSGNETTGDATTPGLDPNTTTSTVGTSPSTTTTPPTTTSTVTTTPPTTTRTVTSTTARTPGYETGRGCSDAWVSLWGVPSATTWEPDAIQVGFNFGPNVSMLLVVEANGSVVGVESIRTDGTGLQGKGYRVGLDRELTGPRAIQVIVYADRNDNGRLDAGVDRPCAGPNGVVDTTTATVDFDRLRGAIS